MLFSLRPPEKVPWPPFLDFKKSAQAATITVTKKSFWPMERPSTELVEDTAAAARPEILDLLEEVFEDSAMLA